VRDRRIGVYGAAPVSPDNPFSIVVEEVIQMRSRSLLRRSRSDEIAKLVVWKLFGTAGVRVFRRKPLAEVPDLSETCMVFLCGLHRSGTSLVHRMLRGADGVTSFTRTGVPEDEGQHLQTVFESARMLGGPGLFAFEPRAHLTETDAGELGNRVDLLKREWGAYLDFSKPFAIEKSPPNLTRSRFFQALFPNTAFVFITRHPVPVALATAAKWHVDPSRAFDHWGVAHKIMLEDVPLLKRVWTLRYESLVADPRACLEPVLAGLGLGADIALEPVVDANAEYFRKWEGLEPVARADIEALMSARHGDLLDRLGYTVP
jgi:Sulfotransferase family